MWAFSPSMTSCTGVEVLSWAMRWASFQARSAPGSRSKVVSDWK
jgi:hypothetical protein